MNGMGQIATLADRLSTMSDQMLPQLAQQYKDDAITLSLILNEKNRRDRVRQTAQVNPQQAMQQPKVNDQVVASMQPQQLPENVGIGTLPTPNIDNMAAGGLVAFADGGDVERYNSQGSIPGGLEMAADYATVPAEIAAAGVPVMVYRQAADFAARMGTSVGAILKSMGYEVGASLKSMGAATGRGAVHVGKAALSAPAAAILAGGIPATKFATQTMAANPKLREAYTENEMLSAMDPDAAIAAAILNNAAPEKKGQQSIIVRNTPANVDDPSNLSGMDRRLLNPEVSGPMPRIGAADAQGNKAPPRTKAVTKPSADDTGVSSLLKQGPAIPYSEDTLAAAQQRYMAPIDEQGKQLMGRRQQLGNVQVQGETENLRSIMERQAAEGDVYKGRGERIAAREAALGKQGEELKGMAILNAGLRLMAMRGPLGEAVGKSVGAEAEKYASGIEKIRAAQERLELAKDTLDDLRLNRSDMNRKEVKDAEASLRKARVDAEKYGLEGAEILFGVKAKNAQDMFSKVSDLYKTQYTEGEQTKRTNAQIAAAQNTPQMQEWRGFLKANNNDPVAAARAYRSATAEKFNPFEAYAKYLTGFAGKETTTPPMSFSEFASQFVMSTAAPPKGAKVYE